MATERRMSVAETRKVIERYLETDHAEEVLAPDVVYRVMETGEEHRGPSEVLAMFEMYYRRAFDADARLQHLHVGEGSAVAEYQFRGKHVGAFAGVAATGRDIDVPMTVAYEIREGKIAAARVYFLTAAFLRQVGALG